MPPKEKTKPEEIDQNLKLAVDTLNTNCQWLKQNLGDRWFLEFAKGLRFFVETHDVVIDYETACKLLNKNKAAIEKATDLVFNYEIGKKDNKVRRFDNDPEFKKMMFSIVSASVVIAKVYHIDPVVYLTKMSLECPSNMKEYNDQLASENNLRKESEKKHSRTGKGVFQLTFNSFPRLLINDEEPKYNVKRFNEYLYGFNTGVDLIALQQDVDFSNRRFLHINPFANALGATLVIYWFLYERNVNSKKDQSFGPEDMFLSEKARKDIAKRYNGGEHAEAYSQKFVIRYNYFKKALEPEMFTSDWWPAIKPSDKENKIVGK